MIGPCAFCSGPHSFSRISYHLHAFAASEQCIIQCFQFHPLFQLRCVNSTPFVCLRAFFFWVLVRFSVTNCWFQSVLNMQFSMLFKFNVNAQLYGFNSWNWSMDNARDYRNHMITHQSNLIIACMEQYDSLIVPICTPVSWLMIHDIHPPTHVWCPHRSSSS